MLVWRNAIISDDDYLQIKWEYTHLLILTYLLIISMLVTCNRNSSGQKKLILIPNKLGVKADGGIYGSR